MLAQSLMAGMPDGGPGPRVPLHARLLPAAGRCQQAHHLRGAAPARRPVLLRPPRPRLPGGRAHPVDDRVLPGRGRGHRPRVRDAGRASRTPSRCPAPPTCWASSTTPWPGTGPTSGPSISATSTRPCTSRPRAQGSAQRRLDEDLRPDARRRRPAPGGAGLRERLHAAGVHPAPARAELDHARACAWPAWTTPCGGTGRSGWTSGCSTSRNPPAPRAPAGLATGKIFNRAGQHVATVAQEGMVRVPTDLKNKVKGACPVQSAAAPDAQGRAGLAPPGRLAAMASKRPAPRGEPAFRACALSAWA